MGNQDSSIEIAPLSYVQCFVPGAIVRAEVL